MPIVTLAEAIAHHVKDGSSVALEGFTHLIPFAAGHEIIRQGRRGLHLIRMTPDLVYDQMIGAGCARKIPERPPVTKNETNPKAKSIGESNWIFPPHNVPSQLKVLIAEGTPIDMVSSENVSPE